MNLHEIDQEVRIDQEQWLILQVALHIEELMEEKGVTKSELARRLGFKRAYITQLLDGTNMTLKTMADVMLALDSSMRVQAVPLGFNTTIEPIATCDVLPFNQWKRPIEESGADSKAKADADHSSQGVMGMAA
jgi:hypothetical protein